MASKSRLLDGPPRSSFLSLYEKDLSPAERARLRLITRVEKGELDLEDLPPARGLLGKAAMKRKRDDLVLRILRNLQADMGDLKRDVGSLKEDVGSLKEDRVRIEARLEQLAEQMAVGFKNVNHRLDGHRKFSVERLREHDQKLNAQAAEIRRILERLDRLEAAQRRA